MFFGPHQRDEHFDPPQQSDEETLFFSGEIDMRN